MQTIQSYTPKSPAVPDVTNVFQRNNWENQNFQYSNPFFGRDKISVSTRKDRAVTNVEITFVPIESSK